MIIERKHKTLIQRLAKYCFQKTSTEEIISRVQAIAAFFNETYPRSAKAFQKYFLLCLQKEFGKRYASVHYVGLLQLKQLEVFLATMGENIQVVAEERPELMGGIKVQHGDTIWDFSIQGQLQALMKTLK